MVVDLIRIIIKYCDAFSSTSRHILHHDMKYMIYLFLVFLLQQVSPQRVGDIIEKSALATHVLLLQH